MRFNEALPGLRHPFPSRGGQRTDSRICPAETKSRNPSYQVLLKPGERIERTAADFFLLDIGNAGGVNLTFQGKPLGSLGKQGEVIHVRLPERPAETKKETP